MRLLLLLLLVLSVSATPVTAGVDIVKRYPKLFKVPPKGSEGLGMLKTYCLKMGFKKGTEKNGECVLKLFTDPMAGMKIECSELGFVAGTEKHGSCVVELFSRAKAKVAALEAEEKDAEVKQRLANQTRIEEHKLAIERKRLAMEREALKKQAEAANRRARAAESQAQSAGWGLALKALRQMEGRSAPPASSNLLNNSLTCRTYMGVTKCSPDF